MSITKTRCRYVISWPQAGLIVRATKIKPPTRSDLLRQTPELKFHGYLGYSLGDFHEFFVAGTDGRCEFTLRNSRVSLGDTSPLAMLLFADTYDRKAHGDEWEYYPTTLRIERVQAAELEPYLLKAIQTLDDASGQLVELDSFGPVEYWYPPELAPVPKRIRNVPLDLEPLRCFFRGRRESEDVSACLQFYRVLEFFAYFGAHRDISVLRANRALSDRDFLRKVATIVFRNEREPIVHLVERLATKSLLHKAVRAGLISEPSVSTLGDELYRFRNAFAHAKYDRRVSMHAPSILEEDSEARHWRHVLEILARAAIARLATKQRGKGS